MLLFWILLTLYVYGLSGAIMILVALVESKEKRSYTPEEVESMLLKLYLYPIYVIIWFIKVLIDTVKRIIELVWKDVN